MVKIINLTYKLISILRKSSKDMKKINLIHHWKNQSLDDHLEKQIERRENNLNKTKHHLICLNQILNSLGLKIFIKVMCQMKMTLNSEIFRINGNRNSQIMFTTEKSLIHVLCKNNYLNQKSHKEIIVSSNDI